jgi:hypothetical protein
MTSLSHAGLKNCLVPILLLAALCAVPGRSQAQTGTWIDIHVNGPWAYVPYSNSQIALVVPGTLGHEPPIFLSGPHANGKASQAHEHPISEDVLHTIEISGLESGDCQGRTASSQNTFDLSIPQSRIDEVLSGKATGTHGEALVRYAIVLPKPCYTSSVPTGDSYVRMDKSEVRETTSPKSYTTWMVLHYYVPAGKFTAKYDKGSITFIGENGEPPSLSFVMRADGGKVSGECDIKSLMSFVASRDLWGVQLYAQFPSLDSNDQQTTSYSANPICKSSYYGANAPIAAAHVTHSRKDKSMFSVGSGDCHHAQFTITPALP